MSLMTPDKADHPFAARIERISDVLKDMEVALKRLKQQAEAGDVESIKEAGKAAADLRVWLRHATELEKSIDEYRTRHTGVEDGRTLDLDAARREIRCRLDRIAPCCGAG